MNLAKKRALPIAPMHIKEADGSLMYAEDAEGNPDPSKPCLAYLHGPASPVFIEQKRKLEREIMEAVVESRKNKNTPQPEVLSAKRRVQFLCAITTRFENVELETADGPVSQALLAHEIYSDIELGYISEQADRFTQDWANFMPGSPMNSSSTSASVPG